ncbi:MAG: putative AlkP superfamily phosphohydrolase/phosphomutase [Natronomonas sp.]|jgi:predicted AlkP superfamily phosphohydrolase/phosphomutase
MIPDGRYTAVVDRIEDGLATILLEEDGEDAYELVVDPDELPEEARQDDAVLTVNVDDEDLITATYEAEETKERREAAQSRFDRLSKRPPKDDE